MSFARAFVIIHSLSHFLLDTVPMQRDGCEGKPEPLASVTPTGERALGGEMAGNGKLLGKSEANKQTEQTAAWNPYAGNTERSNMELLQL